MTRRDLPTEESLVQLFARNCRARRLALGLSQVELAALADTTQDLISHLEAGRRGPHFGSLARIAAALETTPAALLTPPAEAPRPARKLAATR